MSRLLKEEIFVENNKRRNVTMNKYLIFYIILLFLSSCNKVITGRVDKIQYTPWKGGNVLMYKISFCKDGKMDSTYLIGNRIYVKGTYNSFYFEVGDSINIKLGLTEYQNKFISIHKLVKRGNTFVEKRTKTIGSSINRVDIPPLLPTAYNNDDNTVIINNFFNQWFQYNKLKISSPIVFYVSIDTIGRTHIHHIYSDDPKIIDCITKGVDKLPLFTPASNNGVKVNIITSYELK